MPIKGESKPLQHPSLSWCSAVHGDISAPVRHHANLTPHFQIPSVVYEWNMLNEEIIESCSLFAFKQQTITRITIGDVYKLH